jgi:hypothetical protein
MKKMSAAEGTALHEFAALCIKLGRRLEDNGTTLSMYVNDAIGLKLRPEQMLAFSEHCYGTADAIGFRHNVLRVHDLKNGVSPASEKQLDVYCALFCLEYRSKPYEIEMETRIYQNDAFRVFVPDPNEIARIMSVIRAHDKWIKQKEREVLKWN